MTRLDPHPRPFRQQIELRRVSPRRQVPYCEAVTPIFGESQLARGVAHLFLKRVAASLARITAEPMKHLVPIVRTNSRGIRHPYVRFVRTVGSPQFHFGARDRRAQPYRVDSVAET